jgi:hypothetical protein
VQIFRRVILVGMFILLTNKGHEVVFCSVGMVNVLFLALHMYCNPLPTKLENNMESIAAISLALISLFLSPFQAPFTDDQSVLLGSTHFSVGSFHFTSDPDSLQAGVLLNSAWAARGVFALDARWL